MNDFPAPIAWRVRRIEAGRRRAAWLGRLSSEAMPLVILHIVYVVYFLLAGIGGFGLYAGAVRIAWRRLADFLTFGASEPAQMRSLLVSCVIVLVCTILVQFCFTMAATVVRLM